VRGSRVGQSNLQGSLLCLQGSSRVGSFGPLPWTARPATRRRAVPCAFSSWPPCSPVFPASIAPLAVLLRRRGGEVRGLGCLVSFLPKRWPASTTTNSLPLLKLRPEGGNWPTLEHAAYPGASYRLQGHGQVRWCRSFQRGAVAAAALRGVGAPG